MDMAVSDATGSLQSFLQNQLFKCAEGASSLRSRREEACSLVECDDRDSTRGLAGGGGDRCYRRRPVQSERSRVRLGRAASANGRG